MISIRSVGLVIDTVVCLTLGKWETVSGQFGGYLISNVGPTEYRVARRAQICFGASAMNCGGDEVRSVIQKFERALGARLSRGQRR